MVSPDARPDGWLPHDVFIRLTSLLPKASFRRPRGHAGEGALDQSAEELDMLRKAAKLGDLMLSTCRDIARPGVKECEVYAGMMQTMMANAAKNPTLFLWNCDPLSLSPSIPAADHAADRTR